MAIKIITESNIDKKYKQKREDLLYAGAYLTYPENYDRWINLVDSEMKKENHGDNLISILKVMDMADPRPLDELNCHSDSFYNKSIIPGYYNRDKDIEKAHRYCGGGSSGFFNDTILHYSRKGPDIIGSISLGESKYKDCMAHNRRLEGKLSGYFTYKNEVETKNSDYAKLYKEILDYKEKDYDYHTRLKRLIDEYEKTQNAKYDSQPGDF